MDGHIITQDIFGIFYLNQLENEQFQAKYPENVLGYDMTIHYFLVHLNGHLNYHLGQINYHRRLLMGTQSDV